MKKLIQIITAAVLSVGLMAGVAAADTVTCGSISNTGPNSDNTVTCVDTNNVQVSCNNNVTVENSNDQSSSSGGAFTVDNTGGGSATSGDSSDSNSVTVQLGASCAPVVAAAMPTVNTPVATVGGKGAAAPVAPAAAPAAQPVSLPETGSNTAQREATDSVVVLGVVLAVSQLGIRVYRRLALR